MLRINSYIDMAIVSMFMGSPRAESLIGMVLASMRGPGLVESDEELLKRLRDLVGEAKDYFSREDPPSAIARMRVAQDLLALRIIGIADE